MQKDRVGFAFTMERSQVGDDFCREDAAAYARKELEKAGIPHKGVFIEAFENHAGWLVFCTAEKEAEYDVYIRFESSDIFLDAVRVRGSEGVMLKGWESEGYTVRVSGQRGRVAEYIFLMSEYGHPFEAPAGYARHLEEHAI